MAYSTLEDIQLAISRLAVARLTDDNAQAPNNDVVDRAIADADSLIDSYISTGGYAIPISQTTIPEVIRKCSVDIAIYYLYTRNAEELTPDNTRRMNYENAIAFLGRVAEGNARLTVAMVTTESGGGAIRSLSGKRIFPKDLHKYLP